MNRLLCMVIASSILLASEVTMVFAYDNFGKSCVLAHNVFRKHHGAQALVWSVNLAAEAQAWCEELALKDELKHDNDAFIKKKQGESLASIKLKDIQGDAPPLRNCFPVVRLWYKEKDNYNYATRKPTSPERKISHFAQVVWNATNEIGVGIARSSQHGDIICARYSPRGAIGGDKMFINNVFPPVLNDVPSKQSTEGGCTYEIAMLGKAGKPTITTETSTCPSNLAPGIGGGGGSLGDGVGGGWFRGGVWEDVGGTRSMSCGINKNSRIIGGDFAEQGEFPWQVGLRRKKNFGQYSRVTDFFCGGSLVNRQWVVTAAHCLSPKKNDGTQLEVVLGEFDKENEDGNEQAADTALEIVHQNYGKTQSKYDFDIALIKLSRPIQFNDFVRPICLPDSGARFPDGKMCLASGFGTTETGKLAKKLRKTDAPLHPRRTCLKNWGRQFTERMICAGFGKTTKKVYKGDSGGPLACKARNGKYYLAGAVSFGSLVGSTPKPAVYANISNLRNWIDNNMRRG